MTTVPGHNIVLQQSGAAQELSNQSHSPKPDPAQTAAQQEANLVVKSSTVQEFDESEKLKTKKEKDAFRKKQLLKKARKKKEKEQKELDPEATGRLLDTTV